MIDSYALHAPAVSPALYTPYLAPIPHRGAPPNEPNHRNEDTYEAVWLPDGGGPSINHHPIEGRACQRMPKILGE